MIANRRSKGISVVALLTLVLLLATGCKKTMEALTFSEPEKPTRLIERYSYVPDSNSTASTPPAYPHKGLLAQRMKYGVASNPALEQRLNEILDAIEAAWPGQPHPATAFVIPTKNFEAYSTEDGGTFISYNMLRGLKSENEVAAILAHEYSHVVLGHHTLSDADILFRTVYNFGSMYVSAKYGLSKGGAKDILAELAVNELVLEAGQSALLPIFSREQESDADLLGTDLMVAAGYNPRGMSGFLQLLETLETKEKSPEDKAAGVTDIQGKPGREPGKKPQTMSEGINSAVTEISGQISFLYKKVSRNHYSAHDRDVAIYEYVDMFYEDANRDVENSDVWTALLQSPEVAGGFALIDDVKNAFEMAVADETKLPQALSSLKTGDRYSSVPYCRFTVTQLQSRQMSGDKLLGALKGNAALPDALYREHLQLITALESKSTSEALNAAMRTDAEFEHPLELLPTLIRLNKKQKNSVLVTGYLMKCMTTGNKELVAECQKEAGER